MSTIQSDYKRISWNGISVTVPKSWEAKAPGKHHLNFEHNFQAVLEMRWQEAPATKVDEYIKRSVEQFENQTGRTLQITHVPEESAKLLAQYKIRCYSTETVGRPQFMFLFNATANIFIMLQFLYSAKAKHPLEQIKALEYSSKCERPALWSIQDFQLKVPSSFELLSHTMDAGFTVLNFNSNKTLLHVCRLAPAGVRLRQNSLKAILTSLLGMDDDPGSRQISETEVIYERSPSLLRQILLRLQRKRPFQQARIWHDSLNDRLLGVFMEAPHPIDEDIHRQICVNYEIFQTSPKNR